jgi:hypothetical protein
VSSFEEFVFFAKFVDLITESSVPKFKFERVNLRGGRRVILKCQEAILNASLLLSDCHMEGNTS